jgi:hypothetical protein
MSPFLRSAPWRAKGRPATSSTGQQMRKRPPVPPEDVPVWLLAPFDAFDLDAASGPLAELEGADHDDLLPGVALGEVVGDEGHPVRLLVLDHVVEPRGALRFPEPAHDTNCLDPAPLVVLLRRHELGKAGSHRILRLVAATGDQ